jgi:hypothetical protein
MDVAVWLRSLGLGNMRLRSSEPLTRLTCKRAMIEIHDIPAQRFNRTQSGSQRSVGAPPR